MKEGVISLIKFLLGSLIVGFSTIAYIFGKSPSSPYNLITYLGVKIFGENLGWIFGEIIYPIIQLTIGIIASGGATGYIINTLSTYFANQILNSILNIF